MARGKKVNNASVIDGQSFMDAFGITKAAADKLKVCMRMQGHLGETVFAVSNEALTISDYNGFPVGSVVVDAHSATKAIQVKTGATTWVKEDLS